MGIEYDPRMAGKKAIWQGAALLGGAALLSKLIGTLQKIPLQNMAGDEVFGLYSAVYALAVMWMTLASAGIPVAVSVLVAERTANGDEYGAQRVLRWALGLHGVSGMVMFGILWLGANGFASLLGLPDAASAIRMSSLALLVAPATAVLRGYRQGRMEMLRPAVSQLVEQIARVAFMLVALMVAINASWSPSATAASVHGGLAAGAAAGLIAMLGFTGRGRNKPIIIRATGARKIYGKDGTVGSTIRRIRITETRTALLKRIFAVAVPVAIASVIAPLFGLIDAFSIPRFLQQDDGEAAWSIAQYGVYNRGVALLQLVVMGSAAAASALVPALTAARARGDDKEFATRDQFVMRMSWWLGCAAALGLALLASPINRALFADGSCNAAMAIIALAAVGGTLQAASAALLQGMGDLRSPAVNLAAAALLKLTLNAVLVPAHGIRGAAAAMALAFAIAAVLNALSLRQRVQLPAPRLSIAWRSAAALAAMAAAVALLALGLGALTAALPARLAALLVALPGVAVGAAVFAAALVALGAVSPQQWRELPGLSGSRLDTYMLRIRSLFTRLHKEG
ncbi:oligosaccharide flippase family protein [Cohnella cholangitidis]|uniref:Oligosaccharide flippase family protein n=1 Tax=Cohnella cholangitidis TaxID=2598458 RepID=A0A7G5BZ65_9BACL|nr:oligosaccharide flippase family protein [Cohnella cholangitidis]QMV42249.1 oligosaccharide flippase family protein [Cohnella cholangitidis]